MESVAVSPDKFETEVLQSDKPVLVIVLPIDYGDESDASDDSIEFYESKISLAEFKSEVQKTVGDKYKVALVDQRDGYGMGLPILLPRIFPPPSPFLVYEKGKHITSGFFMGFSKDQIFTSLKEQLSNLY